MNGAPESSQQLAHISTRWSCVKDINRFVLRYIDAMRHLLVLVVKDEDDAREVLQGFLTKVVERGFRNEVPTSGRFRDYLARSLRNAAMDHFRQAKPVQASEGLLAQIESERETHDDLWKRTWTSCLIDRAWQKLEHHQYTNEGTFAYSILRFSVENSGLDSKHAAAQFASVQGTTLTPEAYRKQVSRARRKFAQLLTEEVRQTLESPTAESLDEEISSLGLQPYVKG
ncbi:MAG: hypothetical protein AAFX06_05020 [Planctomycetota bacterium]